MTVTLYEYIRAELIQEGFNEFVDTQGNLIFFEDDAQFITKMFSYDADISKIVNKLFHGMGLDESAFDTHFKKGFLYRFANRKINRQTIEAFKLQLLATFMANKTYINHVYADLNKFLAQTAESEGKSQNINKETSKQSAAQTSKQTNNQTSNQTGDGSTTVDNREASARLPQNNVQLDVASTVMNAADDNRISRNKQLNQNSTRDVSSGETDSKSDSLSSGETFGTANGENETVSTSYRLDELFKTNGLEERIYNEFDRNCFMQVW